MTRSHAQQLKRLQTILAATTYRFTPEDAIGFPNPLPAARKIGLGRRALTGKLTAAQKAEGDGDFESSLERDFYLLLEFDDQVKSWHPQPFAVSGHAESDGKKITYYPDVLVERWAAPDATNVTLTEVKYRAEVRANWAKLKPKLRMCREFARERGWVFSLVTERHIRVPRLYNAKFLLPYGEREIDFTHQHRVLEAVRSLGDTTPNDVMDALCSNRWDRAELLPALWFLMARRHVACDLDQRIQMNSKIWSHGRS